jgi:hypothetical protein
LLNFYSCKSQKIADKEKTLLKIDSTKNIARKIYLYRNKKLEVIDTNGSLSYKMEDNQKTNVLLFVYEKDMDKVTYDGGYKEEIVFEVPNGVTEQNYKDVELQNTKMLFGRYCFCRGKNGLFKVKQGKLHIKSSEKEPHFELQFKIDEVPQEITEVTY